MSINDLLNSDSLLPFMVIAFFLVMVIVIPVGIAAGNKTNKSIYGDDEFGTISEEKNVKVLARRTSPHPLNQNVSVNLVVFELENGNRIEIAIKDTTTYGTMVEGDHGSLKYQGKRFICFERDS